MSENVTFKISPVVLDVTSKFNILLLNIYPIEEECGLSFE